MQWPYPGLVAPTTMNQSGYLRRLTPKLLVLLMGSTLAACGPVDSPTSETQTPSGVATEELRASAREAMTRTKSNQGSATQVPVDEPTGFCGDWMCEASEVGWCYEDCGSSDYCGDGYCSGYEDCSSCSNDCGSCYDPNTVNVPGTPQLMVQSDLEAKAQQLGVSPMIAGVPNIESYLQAPAYMQTLAYPTGSTSTQDFVNRLFQSGIWSNTGPVRTSTPAAPDAFGCQLTTVDERYNPQDLVNFDATAGLLFPSALNQGAYINLGVGSLTPIHVPYTQRNPVPLVATFWQTGTSPSSTATDVYNTISQLIQAANAAGAITQSNVYFDMQTASTLDEAAAKFKLDAKVLGGNISAKLDLSNSTQSNTVFVKFGQSLFTVFQDLRGYTPPAAQFNSSFGVPDLENLGNMGELGYDNLPTYVRAVTYGRMLIFSVTSSSAKSELEAAVNAVYGKVSVSATAEQKKLVQESTMKIFAYGGPAEPAIAVIKSGNWQDYFSLVNVPLASLKPLGYEVRRWDDQLATMSRTTRYTERTCPGVRKIKVELSNAYKESRAYVKKTGSTNWTEALYSNGYNATEINSHLIGSDDEVKVTMTVGQPGFLRSYQGRVCLRVYVDGVKKYENYYSCTYCHSQDPVWVLNVNQYNGDVIPRYSINGGQRACP